MNEPTIDFSNIYKVINKVYRKYLKDFRRIQIFKGGAAAGKSHFIAQKIIYNFVMLPGYNGACMRKVAASNHNTTFAELRKVINKWGLDDNIIKINESKGAEEIKCLLNGNKIIFTGMKDAKEREKVKGITFDTGDLIFIWMEELNEFTDDDFNQADMRIRGKGNIPKHLIGSFNPVDADIWIKSRFFDRIIDPQEGFTLSTTYKDNKFLTKEDATKYESYKDIDYYYYMVYCLGEWGSINNAKVFNNIKIHDFNISEHNLENIRHGLDFGYVHAQAFIGSGMKENELYIYREFYEKGMDNLPFIEMVENSGYAKDYPIVADCSRPDLISQWNDRGFIVTGSLKGADSVLMDIDWLRTLKAIHIHQENCPNAAREFSMFKRRQLSDGTICPTQFANINDDTIAATRYGNEDLIRMQKGDSISRRLKGAF